MCCMQKDFYHKLLFIAAYVNPPHCDFIVSLKKLTHCEKDMIQTLFFLSWIWPAP